MSANHTGFSHLFTLRLWYLEDDKGDFHWRGQLHHINSDEIRYFQEWASLMPLLFSMLKNNEPHPEQIEQKESE